MKTLNLLLALVLVSFISCNKELDIEPFSFGMENGFKVNEEYSSIDNSLKFSITEINDSRCPSDVICVWAGKADVKINVLSPVSGKIDVSTFNNPVDTLGNYTFTLIDVSPYPISTKTIRLEDYVVTLKIQKLAN